MLMRFVKLSRENKTVEDITLILSAGIDDDASGPTVIPSGTKLQRALEIFRRSITITECGYDFVDRKRKCLS
jgi:hypothetical protein